MKKIIETVAEGGGELGVHMYPFRDSWKYANSRLPITFFHFENCFHKLVFLSSHTIHLKNGRMVSSYETLLYHLKAR